ncbi:helix-turn-helix transcriptional regulator [Xanthobacter tagetidis]|uniref:helix-turn-helix transcriptional regulator n=1 Tax=Xanthobacter tagetidis TaxID=60216 RepID=UPI0014741D13|nr:helix-turn-helix transcriptional regulator [Xanthobacter tagetidis]MBB6307663.1 DNA-binding CsgD family transcriptional regulator [Xanthobacter tagetidis]
MMGEAQERVLTLWDELADFEAGQCEQAAAHVMGALCAQTGAWNATWAGAVRVGGGAADDPLRGWRVAAVQALKPVPPHADEGHFREILKEWDRRAIDPSFLLPMKDVGAFRTYAFRRDLPAGWFETAFFRRHYEAVGTGDAVFVAVPLNQDCESHFGFYAARPFTAGEIALLAFALRGIKWFHRHLMMSNGLLAASAPLTPAERRVLHLLLTKASEKEIARQVEIATSTAHQHVTNVFRKFGVRSRAELMSLWLRSAG